MMNFAGVLTMLRVHEKGTGWGPPDDAIDVEVVFTLSGADERAFGFQLRKDDNLLAQRGMLDLLRDGFGHQWTVHTDARIDDGKINGIAFRVWLTRPLTVPPGQSPDPHHAIS